MAKIKRKNSEKKRDPVYLPISLPRYKRNKILMLKTMVLLIGCMKRIENMRSLKKEKAMLISELRKILNFSHADVNEFEKEIPAIQNKFETKKIKVTQRVSFEREISYETAKKEVYLQGVSQKTDALDNELAEIKSTLAKLNDEGY